MKNLFLTKFVYAHPTLALLLPFIPALFVGFGLIYFDILPPFAVAMLLFWILAMLSLPIRSAYRVLLGVARAKLERECDAAASLAILRFMREKKQLSPAQKATLDVYYGVSLNAAGHAKEACEWLDGCLHDGRHTFPIDKLQLCLTYASAAGEYEPKRHLLPGLISEMDQIVADLPLPASYTAPLLDAIESAREARRYYDGDLYGLRDQLIKRINSYNGAPDHCANRAITCLWLGRVYEQEKSISEARAMYAYVAEHGGTLGAAAEAKAALSRLSPLAQQG